MSKSNISSDPEAITIFRKINLLPQKFEIKDDLQQGEVLMYHNILMPDKFMKGNASFGRICIDGLTERNVEMLILGPKTEISIFCTLPRLQSLRKSGELSSNTKEDSDVADEFYKNYSDNAMIVMRRNFWMTCFSINKIDDSDIPKGYNDKINKLFYQEPQENLIEGFSNGTWIILSFLVIILIFVIIFLTILYP